MSSEFSFIDLFAGIGGLRRGFESVDGTCVFTSEWDKYAAESYRANFSNDAHEVRGDIREIPANDIPDFDLLLAGFPCQPFSLAGVSKKNSLGRNHGFLDETQGTLFFEIARVLEAKRPKAFVLENVANLKSHDSGRTFEIILKTLRELGYFVEFATLSAESFVPQRRKRIFIVGFDAKNEFSFDHIRLGKRAPLLGQILHQRGRNEPRHDKDRFVDADGFPRSKYTLTDNLWTYLQKYADTQKAKGNGFGYGLFTEHDVARTLSARYYKDGAEILIAQKTLNPRMLTPREAARLMGFPEKHKIVVSDVQAYKQFGNSVVVPLAKAVAAQVRSFL